MLDLLITNAVIPLLPAEVGASATGRCNAVAIDSGKIASVGSSDDLGRAASYRRTLDLGGRTLLPGFNDAHVHIWKVGHLLTSLADLRGVAAFDEARATLARNVGDEHRGWLLGRGLNELRLAEGRLPTRADLDAWFPGRRVWLTRACNHVGIASSAALADAGITRSTPDPPGGEIRRDTAGEPTGVLTENAMRLITEQVPPPSNGERRSMIRAAMARQLSLGITAATDPGVDDATLSVYREMDAAGELAGRYNVMRLAPEDAASDAMSEWAPPTTSNHLRIDTAKAFLDGGLSGATAALSIAYRHAPTRGVLRYESEGFQAICEQASRAGYRIATHVIGDRAITTALDALERLPRTVAARVRFEHFGLPSKADLGRAAELGVGVATQAVFLPELGANFREYLPEAFPITPYPIRQMLDAGILVTLSTDAPVVVDERPLSGVAAAVNRLDGDGQAIGPNEAITVREAIDAYTAAGSRLSGDADRFGAIRPGLWADLVVLDRSPMDTPVEELATLRVEMTLVGGEVVYES